MANCLVTKLKATVDNDELLKIGELRIGVGHKVGDFDTYINSTETQQLKIISGTGTITPVSPVTVSGDIITVPASTEGVLGQGFSSSTDDCLISIPNKYILTRLFLSTSSWGTLNLEDLRYCSYMQSVRFEGPSLIVSGDLSDIAKISNSIYQITLRNTQITGNISSLSVLTNIKTLTLHGGIIEGTCESLVEGQCNAGRNSGQLKLSTNVCTLNGSFISASTHTINFSDTGAVINNNAGTTVATYVKSSGTWTYA